MSGYSRARFEPTHQLPIDLRDELTLRMARNAAYVIVGAVAALVGWAAVAPIDEVAVANGRIVPASAVSDVNHLEGGIVDTVLVHEGDRVKAGQTLMTLKPEQAVSDFAQLETRAANLRLKRNRLTASLVGTAPDFGDLGSRYPKLRDEQQHAFEKDRNQAREEAQQLELAVQRYGDQAGSARREAVSLEAQVGIQAEQVSIREKTYAKGYTSRPVLLQARAVLEETRQRLVSARGRIAELDKMFAEAGAKLRETVAERLRKLAEERADVAAQLAEADDSIAKYRDRVQRLEVTAPISGLVQSVTYKVPGEVVKPGGPVAQIVPDAGGIVAEIELQPRDIGHVKVGNTAEVKLSNYDTNVVGIIHGKVELISATTFENKDGHPFYKVRINLDRDQLFAAGRELPISPGVTLDAQVLTGSKTLLRYMLKPVYQSLDTVFSER